MSRGWRVEGVRDCAAGCVVAEGIAPVSGAPVTKTVDVLGLKVDRERGADREGDWEAFSLGSVRSSAFGRPDGLARGAAAWLPAPTPPTAPTLTGVACARMRSGGNTRSTLAVWSFRKCPSGC